MVTLLNSLMRQRWGVWLAKLKASKSLAALSRAVASVHASEGRYFCPWRRADGFPEECVEAWRCGTIEGEADVKENVNAKPLVADRLTFPPKPAFDPHPYFDFSTAELYDKPLSRGVPVSEAGVPPKVQVRANLVEKLKLYLEPSDRVLVCSGEDLHLRDYSRRGLLAMFCKGFEFGRGQVCLWRQFCMALQQGDGGGGTFIPRYGRQMCCRVCSVCSSLSFAAIVGDLVVLEQVLRTDLAVTGSEPAPGSICEKGV